MIKDHIMLNFSYSSCWTKARKGRFAMTKAFLGAAAFPCSVMAAQIVVQPPSVSPYADTKASRV